MSQSCVLIFKGATGARDDDEGARKKAVESWSEAKLTESFLQY